MRSPLQLALLGLVIARPSYGYELAKRQERLYGDLQPLSGDSHIYKSLDRLAERGLIVGTEGANVASSGTDRQRKLHYRATARGEKAYRAYLIEQMREDRRRSQLLIRQLAVFADEPLTALEILEGWETVCLQAAVRAPTSLSASGGPSADGIWGLVERLADEDSRLASEAKLPWFRYARREFKALAERRGSRR